MRPGFHSLLSRKTGTKLVATTARPLLLRGTVPSIRLQHSRRSMSDGCLKDESSSEGKEGETKQPSGSGVCRSALLAFIGFWAASMSCLSKAAISLDGNLDRRMDTDRSLRLHERTLKAPPGSGVSRYDIGHVASNEPAEDEHQEAIIPVPSGHWSFFGLFDGHNGGDTSKWLAQNLITAVAGALADLYSRSVDSNSPHPENVKPPEPSDLDVAEVLKTIFNRLDEDIVFAPLQRVLSSNSRQAAESTLGPAYAGSCALLSFYDSHSRRLHIALTGDSRAVLGRPKQNDKDDLEYDVFVLSTDHNGVNPEEVARLQAEHPGETVVENGRVLGMGISRAFGDARYKWTREVQNKLKRGYLGRTPLPEVKTPPYLTAEPDVTSIDVKPGDFLIMATDGLWECLTSEEAVGLIGLWKEAQRNRFGAREPIGGYPPDALPVCLSEHDATLRYKQWGAEKRFVMTDINAATHLLRNALGGSDKDLTAALLSMKTPRSRKYRDDMTVLVVFFDEDSGGKSRRRS